MVTNDAPEPQLRPVEEGRYVDFTPVGQGGMGIVYWALDTALSRQIAFKVVRPPGGVASDGVTPSAPLGLGSPGVDTPDAEAFEGLCRRFRQEAWVTGGMEHPGIVPVYELGETEEGVPYYTMRFVRGSRTMRTAIEELADAGLERRLDELLEPFLKVCDTIRYAHSCGVIHRDLKPENVALGEYGETVVLDWGLARVKGGLDPAEDPWVDRVDDMRHAGEFRTVASVLGTPGFMSPEAARGETEALDERSDVYALGVMLFQILTGRLPFEGRTTGEYTEQVLSRSPPDPREHEPDTPERLAALCHAALARDPAGRPASADAVAESIRTWRSEAARGREIRGLIHQAGTALALAPGLRGDELLLALERVTAACGRVQDLEPEHPEAPALLDRAHALRERGIQERERRTRRRTLGRVGAVVLVVGLVVAVVVAALLETRRQEAASARRQAEADRARAEDVMQFMVFELRESLEPIGRLDVLAKLGMTARAYYAQLPREGLSTESLIGHTVTLRRLGEVYEARGDLPAALEAYRLAGEVADRILVRAPDDVVGRYHQSLAEARVGMALFRQGYASDAKRMFVEHREDVVRLRRQHPDSPEYLDALAAADVALGHILRTEGRWDDADRAYGSALAITTEIESRHPDDERWTRARLHRQRNVTQLLRDRGLLERAVEHAQATLAECLRSMASKRRAADVRWLELEAASRYGVAAAFDGAKVGAWEAFTAAYDAYARLHELDPDNDDWRFRVAQARMLQARYHLHRSAADQGLPLTADAFAIAQELTAKDPTNASWQNLLITLCDHMARHVQLADSGNQKVVRYRTLAVEHARHLVTLDAENAKWRHILAYTLSRLGNAHLGTHDEEARLLLTRSIELAAALVQEHPAEAELVVLLAISREDLGRLELRRGTREEALRQWDRAQHDLAVCWQQGAPRAEVASSLLRMDLQLAATLRTGGAEDLARAAQYLHHALEFLDRLELGTYGWSQSQVTYLAGRRQAVVDALHALAPESGGAK